MKKVFGVIKKIFDVILTIGIILFVLAVCLQRFSNDELSIFNYRMFTVVTGSMIPVYDIGDVLVSKEVDVETIKVGDDVTYIGKTGTFKDKVVTHRVEKIETDADGKLVFYTKGIANTMVDPVVYSDQIYGKVVYETFILSAIYKCVGTPSGMFIFVIIPILYIIGSEMVHFMLEKEEKRRNKIKEEKKSTEKITEEKKPIKRARKTK